MKTLFACPLMRALAVVTILAASACSDPEARKQQFLERGNALAAEGKYQEAVLEYRNAIRLDRLFGEARFQLAEAYAQIQSPDAAREYIRAADLLPERADVQTKAALVMLMTGEFEGARKYIDAALKVDPNNVDAQIMLANSLAGLKDVAGAVRELEEAMQLAPEDSRPYLNLGRIRVSEGRGAEAEAAFKRAVEIDPRSISAKLALAYYYWSVQRVDDVHRTLQDALATDPDDMLTNRLLAIFYAGQNRLADAEAPLQHLVARKDIGATMMLADIYSRTERTAQARLLYEELTENKQARAAAIARLAGLDYAADRRTAAHARVDAGLAEDAHNLDLILLKANWLLREQRRDEALELARQAVALDGKSAAAQYTLGSIHAARGELDLAVAAYTSALALNPQFTAAEVRLSGLRVAQGRSADALKHAQAAQKASPSSPEARLTLARATLANGDTATAERQLTPLLAEFPRSAAVHSLHGWLLLAKPDQAGATRAFDKALEISPGSLDALAGRLSVDLRSKRVPDGRSRVERALALRANEPELLLLAARFEISAGEMARAEQHLTKAIEIDPSTLAGYGMLGELYARQNRLDEAKQEYLELARRRPQSVAARVMVGMILDAQNKPEESRTVYEAIVADTSNAPVAANNLAYNYAVRGEQLDVALSLAQKAKAQLPDSHEVSDTLGWIYYQKGMPELAVQALEFSARKAPNNAGYQYHLGMAYAKAGRIDEARETLNRALQLQPNFSGAAEARDAIASLPK